MALLDEFTGPAVGDVVDQRMLTDAAAANQIVGLASFASAVTVDGQADSSAARRRGCREPSLWWLVPHVFLFWMVKTGPQAWAQRLVLEHYEGNGDTLWTLACGLQGLGSIITWPMLGALSDRWGRVPVMALTAFMGFLMYIPLAITSDASWRIPAFLVLMVLGGFGGSVFGTPIAYIADFVPRSEPGLLSASIAKLLFLSFCPALIFGPRMAKAMFSALSQHYVWIVYCGIGVAHLLYLACILPESVRPAAEGEERLKPNMNPLSYFRLLLPNGPAGPSAALLLCRLAAAYLCMDLGQEVSHHIVTLYASETLGWTPNSVSWFITVSGLGKFVAMGFVPILLARVQCMRDPRVIASGGLGLSAVSYIVFCLFVSPPLLYAAHALDGMVTVALPGLMTYSTRLVEPSMKGEVTALISTMSAFATAVGSPSYGVLLNWGMRHKDDSVFFPRMPFVIAGVLEAVGVVILVCLPRVDVAVRRAADGAAASAGVKLPS